MSLDEILSIIMEISTKHCELDPIPFLVFKKLVPHNLPEITLLVNLSLMEGEFAEAWKTAILKLSIKKIGLELKSTSYHPVSNLTFYFKTGKMLYAGTIQSALYPLQINAQLPVGLQKIS